MANVSQFSARALSKTWWRGILFCIFLILVNGTNLVAQEEQFFPLRDVHPGLHGIGRTVFQGNRIEEFQVEILGVIQNGGPKQSIILARLSGGPLAEAGVIQGMSGSPVYVEGKLLGAVALGFAYSKEPIAGIQPIEQMISDATFSPGSGSFRPPSAGITGSAISGSALSSPFGSMAQLLTPVAMNGFTPATLETFSAEFNKLGFQPQQGVGSGSPISQKLTGKIEPGSMISVQLISGDMSVGADGTVTYVDGNRVYAFGHRFLDTGSVEMPFARSEVVAILPNLNTSFKLSVPREWAGTILSDRGTAVAGEIGRPAHTVPATISIQSSSTGSHTYHLQVVNDRLLTPLLTQAALFSAIDATERTLGAGTIRLHTHIDFEGPAPALDLRDTFVSDSGLAQQVALDAVTTLGFILGAGFQDLHVRNMQFEVEPVQSKRQVYITEAWTSAHEAHPGDSVTVSALLAGEDGAQFTKEVTYRIPIGMPAGYLNFTVSDANAQNFPEFAGMNASSAHTARELVDLINKYRGADAVYVRAWRFEPAFTIAGPAPGGDLPDPPPSAMLILADPSSSPTSNAAQVTTRGSEVAEFRLPVDGYVVSGARTVQVEVKE